MKNITINHIVERVFMASGKKLMIILIIMTIVSSGCSSKLQSEETDTNSITTGLVHAEPIQISIDTEYNIDLNKDGIEEKISYTLSTKEPYQGDITSFIINGIEYVDILPELGIYMNNPNWEWYYIVDIDESDDYKEIAILDEGPSEDQETYFIRFDDGKIKFIGSITDFPQNKTCQFKGDGTIIASSRLNIFQTWWAPATWRIDDNGLLQKVKEDMYYPYVNESTTDSIMPILVKNFMIYTEPDLKAKQVMVPANSKVTFKSTDNLHWVLMRSKDGTEGWFYIENFSDILYDGKTVESSTIFDNLNFTD